MSRRARVLISGYYGFGNIGDEAILAGLISGFQELAPRAELIVMSGNPAATAAEHGVIAVPRDLRIARREARASDLVVSGGGGLLQDVTSWRSPLYYLAVMYLAHVAGRPVAFVGQSVGPLRRGAIRWAVRRVLRGVDVFALRDRLSLDELRNLAVARGAEVTADLAFLMPPPTSEEITVARKKAGLSDRGHPAAIVSLRRAPGRADSAATAAELGEAIGRACRRVGLRPVLVALHPGQDAQIARRAAGAMACQSHVVQAKLSTRDMLALVAGCDLLVGMRLHSLVFSALAAVPLVAISYDPKVDGLLDQLDLEPAAAVEEFDPERLEAAIEETWEARSEVSTLLAERLSHLRAAALRNVELAVSLLPDR